MSLLSIMFQITESVDLLLKFTQIITNCDQKVCAGTPMIIEKKAKRSRQCYDNIVPGQCYYEGACGRVKSDVI